MFNSHLQTLACLLSNLPVLLTTTYPGVRLRPFDTIDGKRSCGKVIFSKVSVCHSVWGRVLKWPLPMMYWDIGIPPDTRHGTYPLPLATDTWWSSMDTWDQNAYYWQVGGMHPYWNAVLFYLWSHLLSPVDKVTKWTCKVFSYCSCANGKLNGVLPKGFLPTFAMSFHALLSEIHFAKKS